MPRTTIFCLCMPQWFKKMQSTATQGRNKVRWRPGQEASLPPPCSKLRSFGSKYSVLKKVPVTLLELFGDSAAIRHPPQWFGAPIVIRRPGNCAPLVTPLKPSIIKIIIVFQSKKTVYKQEQQNCIENVNQWTQEKSENFQCKRKS